MTAYASQTEARILALEEAVKDIRDAVVTIARLEERHVETRQAIERCFASAEKNADAIVAANQALVAAKQDSNVSIASMRSDVESLRLQMSKVEGRVAVVEELRGTVMRGVWSVIGLVGAALVGLVLVK